MRATILASKQTGTRRISGTDWPVENYVERIGPRKYLVGFGLCNGIPAYSREYGTRREAFEAAGIEG